MQGSEGWAPRRLTAGVAGALVACAVAWATSVGGTERATTKVSGTGLAAAARFHPCTLEAPSGVAAVAADCATLTVLENPASPAGRRIDLAVARLGAVNGVTQLPPLFVLAGGPGAAAREFFAAVSPAFARVHRDRDIVLVDQRGTGDSNPLRCTLDDDALMDAGDDEIAAASDACRQSLLDRADPAMYTTSLAVGDLDRVREALGYPRIALYGVSYGTRVAQHYLRRHPGRVETLILDGVVPPQRVLGPDIAFIAERSLAKILDRCRADAQCFAAFGDPTVHYRAVRARLAQGPVEVRMPHPRTGIDSTTSFAASHLASALRLSSYTADQASLLPLALFRAHTAGDYRPLVTQYLLASDRVLEQVSYGMHNSVVCAEDAPRFGSSSIDASELDATYIGRSQLDGLVAMCRNWPRGPVDADLNAPLRSSVPTLLLSGAADPVTPATDGELAAKGLSHALHIIVPAGGHGQIGSPCIDRIIATFLATGVGRPGDLSCLQSERPTPFFTSLSGPAP